MSTKESHAPQSCARSRLRPVCGPICEHIRICHHIRRGSRHTSRAAAACAAHELSTRLRARIPRAIPRAAARAATKIRALACDGLARRPRCVPATICLVRAAEPTGRDSTKVLGVHVNLASTLTAAIRTRQACRRRCAAASRMDAAPAAFPPQGTTSSKSALSAPSSLPSPLAAAKLHVISSAGAAWTTMCLLDPRGGRPPGSVREGSLRSLPVLHWSLRALPARISRAASRDTAA